MRAIDIQHRREAMSSRGRRVRRLRLLLGLRVQELLPAEEGGYRSIMLLSWLSWLTRGIILGKASFN